MDNVKKKRFKNLYIIEHGGHHQKIRSTNKYEFLQTGNKFISWSKMNIKNTFPLPPVNYFKVNTKLKAKKFFNLYTYTKT